MESSPGRSLSLALQRLRVVVHGCCWVAAVALLAQIVIWLLAMFTDLRIEQLEASASPADAVPVVVQPGEAPPTRTTTVEDGDLIAATEQLNVNLVFSRMDRVMDRITEIAGGFGAFAMILLLPSIMLGVQLSAGKSVAGAERTVSAFCWTMVVCALILPTGNLLDLPWSGGALVDYETMTGMVDARGEQELPPSRAASIGAPISTTEMYARYLALPVACAIGLMLIGFRFSSGVEMAIVHFQDMRLDPELEREAANMKATSLHAGRSGAALRNVMGSSDSAAISSPSAASSPASVHAPEPERAASARSVDPGTPPQRLI